MRISNVDKQWSIDNDEEVLKLVYKYNEVGEIIGTVDVRSIYPAPPAPIDLNAPYWEYKGRSQYGTQMNNVEDGAVLDFIRVDVRNSKLDLEALQDIYNTALVTKRPEWAAAYIQHKQRVLDRLHEQHI